MAVSAVAGTSDRCDRQPAYPAARPSAPSSISSIVSRENNTAAYPHLGSAPHVAERYYQGVAIPREYVSRKLRLDGVPSSRVILHGSSDHRAVSCHLRRSRIFKEMIWNTSSPHGEHGAILVFDAPRITPISFRPSLSFIHAAEGNRAGPTSARLMPLVFRWSAPLPKHGPVFLTPP